MDSRRFTSFSLCALFLLSLATSLPVGANQTISSDTTWSGEVTLDGNLTIDASSTLTLQAGTNLTITDDYTIWVEGRLVLDGTESQPVTIINNNNPIGLNSNTGWWKGIVVNSSGNLEASWSTITRARNAISVSGDATLSNVQVEDSWVATHVTGTALIDRLSCYRLDISCIEVAALGQATATATFAHMSSTAVRNWGSLNLAGMEVEDSGTAVASYDGSSGSATGVDVTNTTTAVLARGQTSFSVSTVTLDTVGLMLDSLESDGFYLSGVTGTQVSKVMIATSSVSLEVGTLDLLGTGSGWSVESSSLGVTMLDDVTLAGFGDGMRLSGTGNHELDSLDLDVQGILFDVSGTGILDIESSEFDFVQSAGEISSVDTVWEDVTLTGATGSEGLGFIAGKHTITDSVMTRGYLSADTTSIGIESTWASVQIEDLTMSGWSRGILCGTDCILEGSGLTVNLGGITGGSGIHVDGGTVSLESLTTGNSHHGVNLEDGTLHIEDWTGSAHQDATLQISEDQTATVRHLPPSSSNGLFDAAGAGTLYFGGTNARIDVADYHEFTESLVSVSDLSSNPVADVSVTSHGFTELTDSNGEATVPLLSAGSSVTANDGTYGVTDVLTPPSGSLQLPLIPTGQDWVIPMGVDAELVGGTYQIASGYDVIISAAASLTLRDARLELSGGTIEIADGGQLIGNNGTTDANLHTNTSLPVRGIGAGLFVEADFHHACSLEEHHWSGIHVTGDFYLEQTCRLTIHSGSVSGTIHPSMGGWFALTNAAKVRVLDFGQPVEGATVNVQGNSVSTNSDGEAIFIATYRNVTEMSDYTSGIVPVYVIRGSHSQTKSWDPVGSTEIEVMMSTLAGGYTGGWVRLDQAFSPYYLDDNLTVTALTTLTLLEQVSLTVAGDKGIQVDGVMEASRSTILGSDWNGITVTEDGVIELESAQVMGGSLTVGPEAGTASIDNTILSSSPLSISGAGSVVMNGGTSLQSDICVMGNGGSLTVSGTSFTSCHTSALMLTQSLFSLTNMTLGVGNSKGLHLRGGVGSVTGLNANDHDGIGAAVHLEMVDQAVSMSSFAIASGGGAPALSIDHSDGVTISSGTIQGSPAISISQSSASLSGIDLTSNGTGVGLYIEGLRSDPVAVSNCDFDGYETAIHLTGDEGDVEDQSPVLDGNHYHSLTAIVTEGVGFTSISETFDGTIEASGTKSYLAEIWNPMGLSSEDVTVSGLAEIGMGSTWMITVLGDAGLPLSGATLTVDLDSFTSSIEDQSVSVVTSGDAAAVPLLYKVWSATGVKDGNAAIWRATANDYVAGEGSFVLDEFGNRAFDVLLQHNQAPIVQIIQPDGPREVQEGESVNFTADAYDADAGPLEELSYSWHLRQVGEEAPGSLIFTGSSGTMENIGEVGTYVVTVIVSDPWGGEGQDSLTLTVILDDADNDFIDTCQTTGQNAWYDMENERYCGPDVYDEDDDNDFIKDSRDAFPTDPCAHSDFDVDGLPNSILPGCETDLIEDDDDDNDGTLDSADADPLDATVSSFDGSGGSSGLLSPKVILPILVLILVIGAIFLRSSRQDFGGSGQQ